MKSIPILLCLLAGLTSLSAQIGTISDGESGLSVRTKLNAVIDAVNDLADEFEPLGVVAADITDATAAGQSMLTAADASAQRTLLNVGDGADVTDTANVTAAGALMDSELADLAGIKSLDTSAIDAATFDGYPPSAYATAGALANKVDATAVDAALAVRTYPLTGGIYADGTDEAFTVPQSDTTDLVGTRDFSRGLPAIVLPDYTPSSAITLWTNDDDANNGIRLILGTDGTLSLEIGAGTDWDASYTTTRSLSAITPYTPITLTLSIDRSNTVQYYLDGIPYEAVDISASSSIDINTTADWRILDGAVGWVYGQYWTSTELIDSAQAQQYYTLPDSIHRNTAAVEFESDFSTADLDGWNDITYLADIVTSNVDGIDGEDDWMRDVPQANGDYKGVKSSEVFGLIAGRKYRIGIRFFTPAGSEIDDVSFKFHPNAALYSTVTAGSVKSYTSIYTPTSSSTEMHIVPRVGGDSQFSGDTIDDILYFKDIIIEEIGVVEAIDLSVSGATKTDLVGSNDATRGSNADDAL